MQLYACNECVVLLEETFHKVKPELNWSKTHKTGKTRSMLMMAIYFHTQNSDHASLVKDTEFLIMEVNETKTMRL